MKYFIIIDMQNGFTTGSLKNDVATAIIPKIAEEAKNFKSKGFTILATRDTHQKKLPSDSGRQISAGRALH